MDRGGVGAMDGWGLGLAMGVVVLDVGHGVVELLRLDSSSTFDAFHFFATSRSR